MEKDEVLVRLEAEVEGMREELRGLNDGKGDKKGEKL